MTRLLPLCSLLLLFACQDRTETENPVITNDWIAGTFDGAPFRFALTEAIDYYPTYVAARDTVVTPESPGDLYYLRILRYSLADLRAITLQIPLDPLYETPFPITDLIGTLSQSRLSADSYAGCPHVDESSATPLTVRIDLESWDDDHLLVGSFSDGKQTSGTFSLVVPR